MPVLMLDNGFKLDRNRKAVLFDADGVIINSLPTYFKVTCSILSELGKPIPTFLEFVTPPPHHTILDFWTSRGVTLTPDELYKLWFKKLEGETLPVFPEIPGILTELRSEGYLTGIISANNAALVIPFLEIAGISDMFDSIQTDQSNKSLAIRKFCGGFQVPLSQTVWVGDGPRDMEHGRRAGVLRCIGTSCHAEALPHLLKAGAHVCINCLGEFTAAVAASFPQSSSQNVALN